MQIFKDHHVTMHFSQVNGVKGGDFSEMRAYVLGKLMWNPYQDVDSLMQTFMKGYYGDAAPYLYQYQKIMQGALLASGKELWIYDSPITHKYGMLNQNLRKIYNELFDKAEAAVKDDA
jgi:alpha-glucuronidase